MTASVMAIDKTPCSLRDWQMTEGKPDPFRSATLSLQVRSLPKMLPTPVLRGADVRNPLSEHHAECLCNPLAVAKPSTESQAAGVSQRHNNAMNRSCRQSRLMLSCLLLQRGYR